MTFWEGVLCVLALGMGATLTIVALLANQAASNIDDTKSTVTDALLLGDSIGAPGVHHGKHINGSERTPVADVAGVPVTERKVGPT